MQKSRVNWYLNGDNNTHFFHSMGSSRQRRNFLDSLEIESDMVEDIEMIINGVLEYYKKLKGSYTYVY